MKKADILIIVGIGVLALALFGWQLFSSRQDTPLAAEIFLSGELYDSIPLTGKPREILVESIYGVNVLLVGEGGAKVIRSDCPGQQCVHTAEIRHSGQVIACLPHRLTVRLSGVGGRYDAIAG